MDWNKIEEEEIVSAKETCECTMSKLQSLIDYILKLLNRQWKI